MNKMLIVVLSCLLGSIANAQEGIFELIKPMKCSEVQVTFNFFADNFNEKPIWVGKSNSGSYITLLVNQEKRTWTMVEYDTRIACVLGAGETSSKPI